MSEHLTEQDFADFAGRRMDLRRMQAAGAHVRECAQCAAAMDRFTAPRADELWQSATETSPVILSESEGSQNARPSPPRSFATLRMTGALAATLAAIAGTWLFVSSDTPTPAPPPAPPPVVETQPPADDALVLHDGAHTIRIAGNRADATYGRDDWNALARDAIAAGRIDVVRIDTLRPPREDLRGGIPHPLPTPVEPVGIAVLSQSPALRWKGPRGEYVVVIARENGTLAEKSPPVRATTWTPPPLERGVTYSWQLTLRDASGETHTAPHPPFPPALFRVLDTEAARRIGEARAAGARLVAAVLCAQYGAPLDAAEELRAFAAQNRGAAIPTLQRGEPTSTNGDQ